MGFADDLAVVGMAVQLLEDVINPTLTTIESWMVSNGLGMAQHKREVVILSWRRAFVASRLMTGVNQIIIHNEIKHLGVILDKRLTLVAQVNSVAKKTILSAALTRLMLNIGGPAQRKKKLLESVMDSQLLYAVPAWINVAKFQGESDPPAEDRRPEDDPSLPYRLGRFRSGSGQHTAGGCHRTREAQVRASSAC